MNVAAAGDETRATARRGERNTHECIYCTAIYAVLTPECPSTAALRILSMRLVSQAMGERPHMDSGGHG